MTALEREELVNAFYVLRSEIPNGPADLISDLANFHGDFFNFDNSFDPTRRDIHFNLPDEPERDIFFAWHRRQIFELEQAMQQVNPRVSIPFWDSSVDQSVNSPLWDFEFMGQFDIAWGLNRSLGSNGPLPTPAEVISVQAMTDFLLYSDEVERGNVHRGAHVWTGGAMPTPLSPRDPIFYLHHTFVDKLWAQWEDQNPGNSSFISTSMLRYDGTYVFNGDNLPLVNPNDITNTRDLGVFYAENNLAELTNYQVSNTYRSEEYFYYQFLIEVGDDFTIPNGRSARIESVNRIDFQPGFHAERGSSVMARIDTDTEPAGTGAKGLITGVDRQEVILPFALNPDILNVNAYDPLEISESKSLSSFEINPNPFTENLTIRFDEVWNEGTASLFDINGRLLYSKDFKDIPVLELNGLDKLPSGVYVLEIRSVSKGKYRQMVLKK
jgi:tyrosinase